MAKLKENQKAFIVNRLACFETPSDVVEAVKEEFGIEMSRQRVQQYDPTKAAGKDLSQKWRDLFEATRKRFIEDTTEIAISHKAVRLARLQRMADKAEKKGNIVLAAQLLEQAAKEAGDQYTNLRRVAPVNPDGNTPWEGRLKDLTEEELDARIRELEVKVGGS